jgi:hypothetical protein
VLGGALTRYVGLTPYQAAAVWVAFEIFENMIAESETMKDSIPTSGTESFTNVVGDVCANALGYTVLNWWLNRK